jgi:molybdenum cofactor guanylyltransferase
MLISPSTVAGVILAGGAGERMGGRSKALVTLHGKPLIEHAIANFAPQVGALALSVHTQTGELDRYTLPILTDDTAERSGPTAGLRVAIAWCARETSAEWLALSPVDAPFLPHDLVSRLIDAARRSNAPAASAATGDHIHPTISVWAISAAKEIERLLDVEKLRALHELLRRLGAARAAFADDTMFLNINTPEDLATAERIVRV